MLENSPSPEQLEPKQLEPKQLEPKHTDTQSTQLLNESVRRELEQSGLLNSNLNLCLNIVSHCKGDLEKIKEFLKDNLTNLPKDLAGYSELEAYTSTKNINFLLDFYLEICSFILKSEVADSLKTETFESLFTILQKHLKDIVSPQDIIEINHAFLTPFTSHPFTNLNRYNFLIQKIYFSKLEPQTFQEHFQGLENKLNILNSYQFEDISSLLKSRTINTTLELENFISILNLIHSSDITNIRYKQWVQTYSYKALQQLLIYDKKDITVYLTELFLQETTRVNPQNILNTENLSLYLNLLQQCASFEYQTELSNKHCSQIHNSVLYNPELQDIYRKIYHQTALDYLKENADQRFLNEYTTEIDENGWLIPQEGKTDNCHVTGYDISADSPITIKRNSIERFQAAYPTQFNKVLQELFKNDNEEGPIQKIPKPFLAELLLEMFQDNEVIYNQDLQYLNTKIQTLLQDYPRLRKITQNCPNTDDSKISHLEILKLENLSYLEEALAFITKHRNTFNINNNIFSINKLVQHRQIIQYIINNSETILQDNYLGLKQITVRNLFSEIADNEYTSENIIYENLLSTFHIIDQLNTILKEIEEKDWFTYSWFQNTLRNQINIYQRTTIEEIQKTILITKYFLNILAKSKIEQVFFAEISNKYSKLFSVQELERIEDIHTSTINSFQELNELNSDFTDNHFIFTYPHSQEKINFLKQNLQRITGKTKRSTLSLVSQLLNINAEISNNLFQDILKLNFDVPISNLTIKLEKLQSHPDLIQILTRSSETNPKLTLKFLINYNLVLHTHTPTNLIEASNLTTEVDKHNFIHTHELPTLLQNHTTLNKMLEKRNSRLETYLANQKNSHAILQFQKLNHRIKTWINKLLLNTIQTQQDEREFQDINTRYFQNQLTSDEFQTLKKHPNILYLLKLPDIFTHTIDYSMTELKQILIKNILHDQTEKIYSEIPKNKEFIERMTAKGLQLNPWLHGIPNFTIDVDGQEVSIELITDPLEVIQMGNYVEKSCFNINGGREIMPLAYALSANIQVLYAKCNNKVMARTTILINKDGNIVNLKHYSAQGTLGQKISFDSFIKELQKQIGCKEVLHSDIRDNIDKLIFSHIHFDNMTA